MAYVADISTKEDKAKNYGIIGAAFGLGFVLGPVIGGLIGAEWGTRAPFIAAASFSFMNFIFGLFFVSESLPIERRRKINFAKMIPFVSLGYLRKYKAVLGFILALALVQFAGQVMPTTWTFFTKTNFEWSVKDIGLSLMFVGLLVSAVQAGLTGFLVKKYGNKRVIISGFILYTIGMLAISFSTSSVYLYLACVPYILGGIAGPTIQGLVSNNVSELEQGNLQGVLTSLTSLAAIIAPLVFTPIFSFYTSKSSEVYFPGAPFLLGGFILVLATLVAAFSLKSLKQPSKVN
jgi:DHA1 family tetracycline resistance protein-like MFS transporter